MIQMLNEGEVLTRVKEEEVVSAVLEEVEKFQPES